MLKRINCNKNVWLQNVRFVILLCIDTYVWSNIVFKKQPKQTTIVKKMGMKHFYICKIQNYAVGTY